MSESVRIGGIGKNPAIDKINSLNSIDVKNYAVNKMEQLLLSTDSSRYQPYVQKASVDFSKVDWEGRISGKRHAQNTMEANKLSGRTDGFGDSKRYEKTIERNDNEEIPIQYTSTGNIYESGDKQDTYIRSVGETFTRYAGISGNYGNTETN